MLVGWNSGIMLLAGQGTHAREAKKKKKEKKKLD